MSNPESVLALECWEEDTFSNNYIGSIIIPLRELSDGKKVCSLFDSSAWVQSSQTFSFVVVLGCVFIFVRYYHSLAEVYPSPRTNVVPDAPVFGGLLY